MRTWWLHIKRSKSNLNCGCYMMTSFVSVSPAADDSAAHVTKGNTTGLTNMTPTKKGTILNNTFENFIESLFFLFIMGNLKFSCCSIFQEWYLSQKDPESKGISKIFARGAICFKKKNQKLCLSFFRMTKLIF